MLGTLFRFFIFIQCPSMVAGMYLSSFFNDSFSNFTFSRSLDSLKYS